MKAEGNRCCWICEVLLCRHVSCSVLILFLSLPGCTVEESTSRQ